MSAKIRKMFVYFGSSFSEPGVREVCASWPKLHEAFVGHTWQEIRAIMEGISLQKKCCRWIIDGASEEVAKKFMASSAFGNDSVFFGEDIVVCEEEDVEEIPLYENEEELMA